MLEAATFIYVRSTGSGCSAEVEHTPLGPKVVGSSHAGCWAALSKLDQMQ